MAQSYTTVLQDLSGAYELGKLARNLNKSSKVTPTAQVDAYVLASVNVWKEPIQSALSLLLESYKAAARVGNCVDLTLFVSSVILFYSSNILF